MRQRYDAFKFFFTIFQVDGIDDRFSLAIRQRQFNGGRIGGIDHHRSFYLANQFFVKRLDVRFFVALGALQADVHDVRATADLAAGDFAGLLPLFFRYQPLEKARANHVGAFADEQRARLVVSLDGLDAGINGAVRFRRERSRLLAFDHLRDGADVLFGGAAAAAHDVQPAVVDKFLELRRESARRFEVLSFFIRQTRVGIARDIRPAELAQGTNVIGHELRTGGAVHTKRQGLGMAQGGPHGFDRLASEHGAHRLDGDRDDHRNLSADFARQPLNGEKRGFDVARVLAGFNEQ